MLVGFSDWSVILGGFDVHFSVSITGRYKYVPSKGQLGDMLIIFGYLNHHTKHRIICDASLLEDQREADLDLN